MQKRNILFLSVLLLLSTSVLSQTYLGVFGGLNNSKLLGDVTNKAYYKSQIGANFGINLDLKLSSAIQLSFRPGFSQEGTRVFFNVKGKDEPVDSIQIRLNYLSLPLFLKITSTSERFYAIGGIETGILLDSYMRIDGTDEDINETVTDLNIAMHFGVGYRIPMGKGRMFIEIRYSQGLINLTDEHVDDSDVIPRVKTNGMKFLVGYEIPLTKQKK